MTMPPILFWGLKMAYKWVSIAKAVTIVQFSIRCQVHIGFLSLIVNYTSVATYFICVGLHFILLT